MLKELLKQQLYSPSTPSKLILNQIIKGHCLTLYNTTLLIKKNADLHVANKKKRQKRSRSTRQITHKGGLSIKEGLQLVQQPIQPVEANKIVSHKQGDLPTQQDQPHRRALSKCSGCGSIGHRVNHCNKQ